MRSSQIRSLWMLVVLLMAFLPRLLSAQQSATTNAERVNIRSAAAIDAAIVGTLAKGAQVTVLEAGETWTKISAGSVNGWVRTSTLTLGTSAKASGAPGPIPAKPAEMAPRTPTAAKPAQASRRPVAPHAGIGLQAAWGGDSDLGVGARVELNLLGKVAKDGVFQNAFAVGEFVYYFPNCGSGVSCSWWEVNPGLAVPIPASNIDIYAGAGLNIAHASVGFFGTTGSATETGLNIFGGLRFPVAGRTGYGEARLSSGGSSQLAITFGVLLGSK